MPKSKSINTTSYTYTVQSYNCWLFSFCIVFKYGMKKKEKKLNKNCMQCDINESFSNYRLISVSDFCIVSYAICLHIENVPKWCFIIMIIIIFFRLLCVEWSCAHRAGIIYPSLFHWIIDIHKQCTKSICIVTCVG